MEGAALGALLNLGAGAGFEAAARPFATAGLLASKEVLEVAFREQLKYTLFGIPTGVVQGAAKNILVECVQ